jgi:Ala-tRNA(Pro) deacylase
MPVAQTLKNYLTKKRVKYDVIAHQPTNSSIRTAEACHIPGDRFAKAVLLCDEMGYAVAVLPASRHIRLSDLKRQFGDDVRLASEREIVELFQDCARGAIPALGECYGLDTVIDDSIEDQPDIYIEGGDHATLVHMSQEQFADLTSAAQHGRFSTRR